MAEMINLTKYKAFDKLFNRYIHLAAGDVSQYEKAYEWIRDHFDRRDTVGDSLGFIAGVEEEKQFDGFGLSVHNLNLWHPFTIAFEAHRLGEAEIGLRLALPIEDIDDVHRYVLMLMTIVGQYAYVKHQLLLRCFYIVRQGDTWSSVAVKFNTTVDALCQLNPNMARQEALGVGMKVRVGI